MLARDPKPEKAIIYVEQMPEVSYLLAVYTALIGLDADELLAGDGNTVSEGVVTGGVGRDQRVNFLLGELCKEAVVLATCFYVVGTPPRITQILL
jgi:hypothetical protein